MKSPDKPARVISTQVEVVPHCPLCREPIRARVEVAVWVGDLVLGGVDDNTPCLEVSVEHKSTVRTLSIVHNCVAPDSESEAAQ
jgi:ribosomal protein L37AE/L43A